MLELSAKTSGLDNLACATAESVGTSNVSIRVSLVICEDRLTQTYMYAVVEVLDKVCILRENVCELRNPILFTKYCQYILGASESDEDQLENAEDELHSVLVAVWQRRDVRGKPL